MVSLSSFLLNSNGSIRDALDTINNNGCGICFVVKDSVLIGIATDGDVRRALLNNVSIDASIELAMNKSFKSLPVNSDPKTIRDEISHKIRYLPLCDGEGRLVDVADIRRSHTIPVLEPKLEKTEFEYVHDCLETGWISSQGRYVKDFEQIFSEMHSGMTALAVSNGTTALHLALMALGISDDDEVIVPNITFAATINAVLYCNATPVICEVSYADWCIDVNELEKLITPKTKAVIPVHLYGVPCEMDKLVSLCKAKSIHIIEDCAESLGSKFDGTVVGTFGDAATFSFFGNKTISTGEGGMVLFKDKNIAQFAATLRDHGMSKDKRYWHNFIGYNYRLTNIQAAIGLGQMQRFDSILSKKIFILNYYNQKFRDIHGIQLLPGTPDRGVNSNWLYTIVLQEWIDRDLLASLLLKQGIETRPTFYPLHEMPPYSNFRKSEDLSNSMLVSKHGLCLPTSIGLKESELEYVSNTLIRCIFNMHSEYGNDV